MVKSCCRADRILFSADWTFENIDHAANWFYACTIAEADRLKIGRTNALALFKIGSGSAKKLRSINMFVRECWYVAAWSIEVTSTPLGRTA